MFHLKKIRYSLRAVLLCTTLGCVFFGGWINSVREQRNAVARARRAGAVVFYPHEFSEHSFERGEWRYFAGPAPRPQWITDLGGEDCFTSPVALGFPHDAAADDFDVVGDLPSLKFLRVYNSKVADLAPVARLHSLRELRIVGSPPIADVSALRDLKHLELIELNRTEVSDIGPLAELPKLKCLKMGHNPVSDIAPLATASSLEELNLFGTNVEDLTPLAGLKQLRSLDVAYTRVKDISPLGGLESLASLRASGNAISDASVLAELPALIGVDLSETEVAKCSFAPGARLYHLNLSDTKITDVEFLRHVAEVKELALFHTSVQDLGPLSNVRVEKVYVSPPLDENVSDPSNLIGP